jgi:hypothetical protein
VWYRVLVHIGGLLEGGGGVVEFALLREVEIANGKDQCDEVFHAVTTLLQRLHSASLIPPRLPRVRTVRAG